jgi:hypothetical protein
MDEHGAFELSQAVHRERDQAIQAHYYRMQAEAMHRSEAEVPVRRPMGWRRFVPGRVRMAS